MLPKIDTLKIISPTFFKEEWLRHEDEVVIFFTLKGAYELQFFLKSPLGDLGVGEYWQTKGVVFQKKHVRILTIIKRSYLISV